jgi:hypothetical protein
MRAQGRWGIGLAAFLGIGSMELGMSDSALAQNGDCEALVDRATDFRGPDVERMNELYHLASNLQTPVGEDSQCRARGLRLICEVRPEAAIPVLQRWRGRADAADQQAVAECLLGLMNSPEERAEPAVREYLFSDPPLSNVLLTMLRIAEPASRERLAPLVRAIAPESPHRGLAFSYLCTPPTLSRLRAECEAEIALAEQQRGRPGASRHLPLSRRRNADLIRAVTITTVSVAIAGLHVGLSAHYRNDETNLGGLFAYQGALGGAMLIAGLGTAATLRKNVTLTQLAAALIFVPIGMLAGGIAGGFGGYKLGEPPGNGRVGVSVVSQALILGSVLGFSWAGVRP